MFVNIKLYCYNLFYNYIKLYTSSFFRSIPVYFIWLKWLSWFKYANENFIINQWEDFGNIGKIYLGTIYLKLTMKGKILSYLLNAWSSFGDICLRCIVSNNPYFVPLQPFTAWKVSLCGVILVHIQSECGKIRTRITQNMDTFYAMIINVF